MSDLTDCNPRAVHVLKLPDHNSDRGEILNQSEWCVGVALALSRDSHHWKVSARLIEAMLLVQGDLAAASNRCLRKLAIALEVPLKLDDLAS